MTVMSVPQSKGDTGEAFESLVPGLSRSCQHYLRYIQSVPRMLPVKPQSPRK